MTFIGRKLRHAANAPSQPLHNHTVIGVMTLTFKGHLTSSVTWPFNSLGPISYRHYTVTMPPPPAIFEIMGTKHIGVMTLTFQGHVTSSVT